MKRTIDDLSKLESILHSSYAEPKGRCSGAVYLSGPVEGYFVNERRTIFGSYERELAAMGFEVFNPMNHKYVCSTSQVRWRNRIMAMTCCECVYFLPGWEDSEDCQLELKVAVSLGLQFMQSIPSVENKIAMHNMKGVKEVEL